MPEIDDDGRVSIPDHVVERLGVEPGRTHVHVTADSGRIVLEPDTYEERDPEEVLARMDELLEEVRNGDVERVDSVNERDPYAIHHRETIRRAAEDDG